MRKLDFDKNIVAFIILIVILLSEMVFFLPLAIRKNTLVSRRTDAVKTKVDSVEKDWPNKDSFLEKNDMLRQEIKQIKTKLFLPQQRASILSYISSESEAFDIEIQVLRPSPLQDCKLSKSAKLKYLPVVMKARGKFHDLVRFLEHLQTDKYFFEIKKIDIVSGYSDNSVDIILTSLMQEEE